MNQAGIDVLIQAGLAGHPQGYGRFHKYDQDCALGVLHLTMHATRGEALECYFRHLIDIRKSECFSKVRTRYQMTKEDEGNIIVLNDKDHLDFIGIARKLEGHIER